MANATKFFLGLNHEYFSNGQQVEINGMLDIYEPGANMRFWIIDDHNVKIWDSGVINEPYNHGNYELVKPPSNIFKCVPPYYRAWGESYGLKDSKKFAYYK